VTKEPVATLPVEPLTAAAFAPFGEVIEPAAATQRFPINAGSAERFHALAQIETDPAGHALISLVRAQPQCLPITVVMLERHPLGSQAFVPLDPAVRYLVVVAESADATPRAFLASGGQGVNYRRGAWHHPLLALDRVSDFLVLDRGGAGDNCEEVSLLQVWLLDV
jgi:ureidoglycolate lyase